MSEDREKETPVKAHPGAVPEIAKTCPKCGLGLAQWVTVCPQDGTIVGIQLQEDDAFRSKYEFLETIGAGGMGVIYKARQIAMNRLVAIKVLRPGFGPDALRRFQTEAKAASKLSNKYIITVHDLGMSHAGQPYIVMDYVEGTTFAQYLAENGPLDIDRFLRFFLQICDALAHAHSRNVLHRDLKPSNIMLLRIDGADEVRIMDFGIAKVLDDTESGEQQVTKTGEAIGSPLYMSPEQCRGAKLDTRSDLYSLGCVMYESLTGGPPFLGQSSLETMIMHIEKDPLPLAQASLGLEIEQGLEDIIFRLLKKDATQRYQSINELETDLLNLQDAIIGGKKLRFIYKPPEKQDGRRKSERRELPRMALIAAAVLVAIATVAFIVQSLSKPTPQAPMTLTTTGFMEDEHKIDTFSLKEMIDDKVKQREPEFDIAERLKELEEVAPFNQSDLQPLQNATNALISVRLYGHEITDTGLQYLKNLQLKKLTIDHTDVQKLTPIKNMVSLNALDVSYTRLDGSGMHLIGGLHNLQRLYLQGTGIEDADLQQLGALKKLVYVNLSNCSHLSESAILRLRAVLPKCDVFTDATFDTQLSDEQRKRIDEARTLRDQLKWAAADAKYSALLSELKRESIPNNPLIAHVLTLRGECLGELHDYHMLVKCCQTAKEMLADSPENELQLAGILTQQAAAYEALAAGAKEQKQLAQQAVNCRAQASKLYERHGANNLTAWSNLSQLASDYEMLHDNLKGIEVLDQTIKQCERARQTQDVPADFLSGLYIHQATMCENRSSSSTNKNESRGALRQACAARESAWKIAAGKGDAGKRSDQLLSLSMLITLAADYRQLADNASATRVLDSLISYDDKVIRSGALSPRLQALAYGHKAAAYENKTGLTQERPALTALMQQAVNSRERARKLYETNGGNDDVSLSSLLQLGSDYGFLHDYAKAVKLFDSALHEYKKLGQGHSLQAAGVIHNRASMYSAMGSYAEALKDYEAAADMYRINQESAGPDWEPTILTLCAKTQNQLGHPSKAEGLLRKSLLLKCKNLNVLKLEYEEMTKALAAQHKDAELESYRAKIAEIDQKLKQAN